MTLRSPGSIRLARTVRLVAQPAGVTRGGTRRGRTFRDPRTSCGDRNGSTLHVAKRIRRIQNPQSCRQAHRKSHLSGAPLIQPSYPRYPIQLTVISNFLVRNCGCGLFTANRKAIQSVYQRGTTYYFVMRVPKDVQRHSRGIESGYLS